MRKWIQTLFLFMLAVVSLGSCIMDIDKELPDCLPDVVEDPIAVTASLYCGDKKVAWADSSRIGVIMLQGGTDRFVYTTPVKPYFLRDAFKELFAPVMESQMVGRPAEGTTQDATGIFPVGLTVNDRLEVAFSVADQSNQNSLDLFVAKRTKGITHETDTVHIDFYRQLSRLQFSFKMTEIDADGNRKPADDKLAGAKVEVKGMDLSGSFSLKDFALSTSNPGIFQALATTDGKAAQAIVFPRKAGEGITFQVSFPQYKDTVYTFAMDPTLALTACMSYVFAMNLEHRVGGGDPDPGPGPDPGPDPDLDHKINYTFEGDANNSNVTVYKNGISSQWSLSEIITVKDHGSFIFGFDSQLAVTIRTADGRTISLSPNTPYTFTDITKDITIIISAKKIGPDPLFHKINYIFEGEANANNVQVLKNNMFTGWGLNEVITVPNNGSFSFGYNSSITVTVRNANGTTYRVNPGQLFTLSNITSDITLIISGEPEETPTVFHRMTYEYKEGTSKSNVEVTGSNGSVSSKEWEPDGDIIYVIDGGKFTFKYNKKTGAPDAVTVTMNGEVLGEISDGNEKVFANVREDMHFVVYGKKYHKVTVITNLLDKPITEVSGLYLHGNRFEMTVPKLPEGQSIILTVGGVVKEPIDGKWIIDSVEEDWVITITQSKGDRVPDLVIWADVHKWVELPVVDGGVITPDEN